MLSGAIDAVLPLKILLLIHHNTDHPQRHGGRGLRGQDRRGESHPEEGEGEGKGKGKGGDKDKLCNEGFPLIPSETYPQ